MDKTINSKLANVSDGSKKSKEVLKTVEKNNAPQDSKLQTVKPEAKKSGPVTNNEDLKSTTEKNAKNGVAGVAQHEKSKSIETKSVASKTVNIASTDIPKVEKSNANLSKESDTKAKPKLSDTPNEIKKDVAKKPQRKRIEPPELDHEEMLDERRRETSSKYRGRNPYSSYNRTYHSYNTRYDRYDSSNDEIYDARWEHEYDRSDSENSYKEEVSRKARTDLHGTSSHRISGGKAVEKSTKNVDKGSQKNRPTVDKQQDSNSKKLKSEFKSTTEHSNVETAKKEKRDDKKETDSKPHSSAPQRKESDVETKKIIPAKDNTAAETQNKDTIKSKNTLEPPTDTNTSKTRENDVSETASNNKEVVKECNEAEKGELRKNTDIQNKEKATNVPTKKEQANANENKTKSSSSDNKTKAADGSNRSRSKSKVTSERSRSPSRSTRSGRAKSTTRRRSRSPIRRRSRSPYRRRSPSRPRRRTPVRRPRSPYRRKSRSRSRDRFPNPKALIAKKSFLDDLAVKFAQEGKEFPELEQYRCEVNSQFVTYPTRNRQSPVIDRPSIHRPPLIMDLGPRVEQPQFAPVMMMDLYGTHTIPVEEPSMFPSIIPDIPVQYPLPMQQPVQFTPTPTPLKPAVVDCQSTKLGPQPQIETKTEVGGQFGVEAHVTQAIQLLDDLDLAITRSSKFMYRAPTLYNNDVNKNRSPLVQSASNAVFRFTSATGDSSDPFDNVPKKLQYVINKLCLDEGAISKKIWQRHTAASIQKEKAEVDERQKRLQSSVLSKMTLQKTTQTDPTVCTECLVRKLKPSATHATQTFAIRKIHSGSQTKPMPVERVTDFGSVTELTPNQVRAVSELIRYIKLTATTGTLTEMRNAMRENQVETLNSDLKTAYTYFDEMVKHKNRGIVGDIDETSQSSSHKGSSYHDPATLSRKVSSQPPEIAKVAETLAQTIGQHLDALIQQKTATTLTQQPIDPATKLYGQKTSQLPPGQYSEKVQPAEKMTDDSRPLQQNTVHNLKASAPSPDPLHGVAFSTQTAQQPFLGSVTSGPSTAPGYTVHPKGSVYYHEQELLQVKSQQDQTQTFQNRSGNMFHPSDKTNDPPVQKVNPKGFQERGGNMLSQRDLHNMEEKNQSYKQQIMHETVQSKQVYPLTSTKTAQRFYQDSHIDDNPFNCNAPPKRKEQYLPDDSRTNEDYYENDSMDEYEEFHQKFSGPVVDGYFDEEEDFQGPSYGDNLQSNAGSFPRNEQSYSNFGNLSSSAGSSYGSYPNETSRGQFNQQRGARGGSKRPARGQRPNICKKN